MGGENADATPGQLESAESAEEVPQHPVADTLPQDTDEDATSHELAALRAENAALRERLAGATPGDAAADRCFGGSRSSSTPHLRGSIPDASLVENATLDDRLPKRNASATGKSALGELPPLEKAKSGLRSKGTSWTPEESSKLRRLVKRIIRKGTKDKDALWTEVSSELGTGRSARECKLQYARDYRAHKAKTAELEQVELNGESTTTATHDFRRCDSADAGVLTSRRDFNIQRPSLRFQPLPDSSLFQSSVALSQTAM